jgi:hypothetical protein
LRTQFSTSNNSSWQTNWKGWYLHGATLTDADLRGTTPTDAKLEQANLTRANLFEADLTGGELYGAVLADIQFDKETEFGDHYADELTLENVPEDESDLSPWGKARFTNRQSNASPEKMPFRSRPETPSNAGTTFDGGMPRARILARRTDSRPGSYRRRDGEGHPRLPSPTAPRPLCRPPRRPPLDVGPHRRVRPADTLRRESGPGGRHLSGVHSRLDVTLPDSGYQVNSGKSVSHLRRRVRVRPAERAGVLGTHLYFSTVTLTTLGDGDFQPVGWARWIATVESFVGALLMALLTFVLGRRATR